MNSLTIEQICNHAIHLRNIGQEEQAKIYIVGCYCPHTKPNCLLRQYWAQMRLEYNNGIWTVGSYVSFRNYYEMACGLIEHLFGHYAWYNTLT